MSTNTPTDEANSNAQNQSDGLMTIIPNDRIGSVGTVDLGLRMWDIPLILTPPTIVWWVWAGLLGFGMNFYHNIAVIGVGVLTAFIISITPWYLTPMELITRSMKRSYRRLKMPLVGESAWETPGVKAVLPDHDAVVEDGSTGVQSGTVTGFVRVDPAATGQYGSDEWLSDAISIAHSVNGTIARHRGEGFDVSITVSSAFPDPGEQVDGLDEIATSDRIDVPPSVRKFAADQADHYVNLVDESGVMDRSIVIAVPVEPIEVERGTTGSMSDGRTKRLLSGLKPKGKGSAKSRREAQLDLLDSRIRVVENAVSSVTQGERMDTAEIIALYRRYWLDREAVMDHSALSWSGTPIPSDELKISGDEAGDVPAEPEALAERRRRYKQRNARSIRGLLGRLGRWIAVRTSDSSRWKTLIAPAHLDEKTRYVDLDGIYTTTLWVTGWPRSPEPGLIDPVLSTQNVRYDLSINLTNREYHDKLFQLKKKIDNITATGALSILEMLGLGESDEDEDAEDSAADHMALRQHMKDDGVEAFEGSVAITIRADSEAELKAAREAAEANFTANGITSAPAHKQQLAGLITTSPTAGDRLDQSMKPDINFDFSADVVGALNPFGGGIRQDSEGVIYGMAKTDPGETTQESDPVGLLQINRWSLPTPHRYIVGRSGSGKSHGEKIETAEELIRSIISNTRDRGHRAVVIDIVRGGFDGVVNVLGGTKIIVGETNINPFEIKPPHKGGTDAGLDDRVRLLTDMFEIELASNATAEKAAGLRSTLSMAIRRTYNEKGITRDLNTHVRESPTMDDFFDVLKDIAENPGEYTYKGTEVEKEGYKSDAGELLNRLKQFQPGGDYDFLCGPTDDDVNLYDTVVFFDMHHYADDTSPIKRVMTRLITAHSYELAKFTGDRTSLIADEAHDLFKSTGQVQKMESLVRAGRNAGLAFDFISQADEDFDEGSAKVIAEQCSIQVWHDLGGIDVMSPTLFGLSSRQARIVGQELAAGDKDVNEYAEALVVVDGDPFLIEQKVSETAHRVADYKAYEWEGVTFKEYLNLDGALSSHEAEPHNQIGLQTGEGDEPHGAATDGGCDRNQ